MRISRTSFIAPGVLGSVVLPAESQKEIRRSKPGPKASCMAELLKVIWPLHRNKKQII